MDSSEKSKISVYELYLFITILGDYEEGIVEKIRSLLHYTPKTNEELQLTVNDFFTHVGQGTKKYGAIKTWDVWKIKQITIDFPRTKYCMENDFKILNWTCQNEPIFRWPCDYDYSKSYYQYELLYIPNELEVRHTLSHSMGNEILDSIVKNSKKLLGKKKETQETQGIRNTLMNYKFHKVFNQPINYWDLDYEDTFGFKYNKYKYEQKKMKHQTDRTTFHKQTTQPKIKSAKMQMGKRC